MTTCSTRSATLCVGVDMGEDLTLLIIGSDADGAFLEIGVLDLDGDPLPSTRWRSFPSSTGSSDEEVITTRHTDEDIEQAAKRFDELTDGLDPAAADVDGIDDLRAVAAAADAARADDVRLREAVEVAGARGRSWNHIALALGVSRQAARQRFIRSDVDVW